MKGIRVLLASIRKADKDFNLISSGDKIVVGISGGKDSMALIYSLFLYKKFSKCEFELYPVIIDLGFPCFEVSTLEKYISSLGLKLEILHEKQVFQILQIQQEKQKLPHLPCSICSRMKKAIINKYAEKIGANKVSFAHHKDDAIETLFLNEIYGGRIATFSPKMFLSNDQITFIRPFIYAGEKDIVKTIKEENIPTFTAKCPNDKHTKRQEIKEILNNIYQKYPSSEENFLSMLQNYNKQDIFYMHQEHKIEGTSLFYKLVRTQDELLDFLHFSNVDFSVFKKEDFKFLIYSKKDLVGSCSISKISDRNYKISYIKFVNQDDKELFIQDIYKEFYDRFNPMNFFTEN
ncbi:MAG: ATP-binding protein [Candidatus Onthovivens sp.]|nr:ATP-binding protein [Candidatus Onthovivens sp.]